MLDFDNGATSKIDDVLSGPWDFSVSPRPFGFGFETKGLGLRVWGQGLTIFRLVTFGLVKCIYWLHRFLRSVFVGGWKALRVSEDKFENWPRHISRIMRKQGTGERFVIKGSLGAGRQSKTHYTTAVLCEKGWNEIKIVLFSRLHFAACGAAFIADLWHWEPRLSSMFRTSKSQLRFWESLE